MPKEVEKRSAEYKAGIFILVSIVLLIFSIFWLRYFIIQPTMTVIAKFRNPGPVSTGLPVYYQGVNIGRVSDVRFSEDFKHTFMYLDFHYKGLKLPENVIAKVELQGITGQKYIDINYPDNPSSEILSNNDIIAGKSPFGFTEIQEFLERQVKSGKLDRIFDQIDSTLGTTRQTSLKVEKMVTTMGFLLEKNKNNIDSFLKQGSNAAENISHLTGNIDDIVSDPQIKSDLKSAISSTKDVTQNVNEFIGDKELKTNIKSTVTSINQAAKTAEDAFLKTGSTINQAGELIGKTGQVITGVEAGGGNIIDLITTTLKNTNEAAVRFSCLNCGLSKMLSKRFVLLRLIFGKPGAALEQCVNPKNCKETPPELKNKIIQPCPAQK